MSKGVNYVPSDNYEIENPREVWEINSEWLLVTGSLMILCVTSHHHTSRDRSHFLRIILCINNTTNTFYETKVLKTKHVSFLKYIYNALLISYRTFGPVSLRNLPVQQKIYWSRSIRPVPISTAVVCIKIWKSCICYNSSKMHR